MGMHICILAIELELSLLNVSEIYLFIMIFPRHEPPLQTSSSPVTRI